MQAYHVDPVPLYIQTTVYLFDYNLTTKRQLQMCQINGVVF